MENETNYYPAIEASQESRTVKLNAFLVADLKIIYISTGSLSIKRFCAV